MSFISGSDLNKLLNDHFEFDLIYTKTLFIILGLLGDFDSFEYIQSILPYLEKLREAHINLVIIGIGDNTSKKYFCDYTKLPYEYLNTVPDSKIHNKLCLESGLDLPINPIFNLTLMCLGINSPGTIKEVLRGYTGDKYAKQIFNSQQTIDFFTLLKFKAEIFDLISKDGSLRPFELASMRLMNMLEVISKWNIYMNNHSCLTQRSGTFLIGSNQELLYSYKSRGLLSFSETMSNPMQFLQEWL
ncbi:MULTISPECIES: AhpC/TSA family protein [unclassified Prochlorococcus]|uniref:AhpC/TSA family protein n=1 Tax=unclassified Prochlorococcus TaxID=2627481 RepID=UPI0005338620|nr:MULTISPECIES: AhpC/TSA family protein [unclassified Prochlorococcus]KGG15205.1 hypothetical protein EV06_1074 [Prochlorococcus sp. MIT 0602]KGG17480.1 hypothetical protein EV07_0920 [Prochlorococcus sp. MIT 0603]